MDRQEARVEMVVIAGEDLKNVTSLLMSGSKMSSYVVCWVDPCSKRSTRIIKRGGRDPVWNEALSLPVDAIALANPYACLTLQVMSSRSGGDDAVVGKAWMPLHEIARLSTTTSAFDNIISLGVQRPSGRMQGSIRLCVCLIGAGFHNAGSTSGGNFHPGKPMLQIQMPQHQISSPVESSLEEFASPSSSSGGGGAPIQPVEGIPVIGFAAGATSYHQGHHHFQMPPYLPSPSAPPVLPDHNGNGNGNARGHGHGNGNGLLLGLLGGALAALVLGDIFFQ
ncbi:uncharacterized protein LOC112351299 [Selaginella moellendorffii]|uniref:uncharacterized protein LOC112351299 n=1 Tax=Selaginella moellendorffii TaxID=88036 RepID=UPI000D1CA019|nr:uncharacterized protein LOC112351299 [Selaginella moellendorffii]|eukprot:XP_024544688.1 uncharacterized protein LOC112351299 [Selaginella moellendorffii]